jgi:CDGSH-type Zn-finger protein
VEVTIEVRRQGPLLVRGPFTLVGHGGGPFDVLCRCGGYAGGPFCDGDHESGFDGTCPRQRRRSS